MSTDQAPRRQLPPHPSQEYLRKEAKRLARAEGCLLATAQARIARDHGFSNWAALMRAVLTRIDEGRRSPLSRAAATGDEAAVRALLAAGAAVDGEPGEVNTPLYLACGSDAPAADRIAVAARLLDAGAFPRAFCEDGATPLHAAARTGPASLVELLLRRGALFWQGDGRNRRPFDVARDGTPADRERILALLADGPKIADPMFRAAVSAIQSGDAAALARLLDDHPRLLTERALEPELGPPGYFSDPALFWFIANNPTLIPRSPPNIADLARLMLARGVKPADVDYALALVMTNGRMSGPEQIALASVLTEAGGRVDSAALLSALGHGQTAVVAWLVEEGRPLDAVSAAGLGRIGPLPGLLKKASGDDRQAALAAAVINRQADAVRLCLEAGADPNRRMPVHTHSTPLHQAALEGDLPVMRLLLQAGADRGAVDTLWRGTPLDWAQHGNQAEAADLLQTWTPD
ncbi:ankyrin repeat domain-containing protein [Brevundimonas sp.]|uniref:ankyrin repeat domain-containing protein n=1 Tax=Brevundimonas sp. TaxID=1871086 RepID=UPI002ED95A20